jgi:hypothetical protein
MQQSAHQTDRRRLARAVWADEAEHLASLHVEAQPGERLRLAVSLDDAIQYDRRLAISVVFIAARAPHRQACLASGRQRGYRR